MKKPELLMPAGSLQALKTAVRYGADAIYLGGEMFGLRAAAKNFTDEQLSEGIAFAHEHGVFVYVTVNISAHNADLEQLSEYLLRLAKLAPDALIISDMGVFAMAKRLVPQIDIHISTQANSTNYETFRFWHSLGAKRVVGARELSLSEIADIRKNIPPELEIECFVHGAMCMAYSGRCLMSNFLAGRDANRGACTHPCRWEYSIVEHMRPDEVMQVVEDERGTYIFNSKDMCLIEHLPELLQAGIGSLKVEGRMKNPLYIATVARAYRRALDDLSADEQLYRSNMDWYKLQLESSAHREFSTGFYFGKPTEQSYMYDKNSAAKDFTFLGTIEQVDDRGLCLVIQKNKFSIGDTVEILKPDGRDIAVTLSLMLDEQGQPKESAPHPLEPIYIDLGEHAEVGDVIAKR